MSHIPPDELGHESSRYEQNKIPFDSSNEVNYLRIERELAQLEKIKLLKDDKRNSWQLWLSIFTLLLVVAEILILVNQTKLMKGQNEIMGKQNEIMGKQTDLFETQNSLFGAQNDLVSGQNSIMLGQNGLLVAQNGLVSAQNELLSIQNDRVTQQNHLIEAQRRSSYTFILANLMDQINAELNDSLSNPKRLLSEHTKNRIISMSHFLTPYIFMDGNLMTTRAYSPERGLLLDFLLESQISTHELNYILGSGNFQQIYGEALKFYMDTIYWGSIDISNSLIKDLLISNSRLEALTCFNCDIVDIQFASSQCSNITILTTDSKDNFRTFISGYSTLISSSFSSEIIEFSNIDESYFQDVLIQAYHINDLTFRNSTANNLSIISDTIGQISCQSSVLIGNNYINSADDPIVIKSWRRFPSLVRDIPKTSKIYFLRAQNSIIEHFNTGTVIDTTILELSVLETATLSHSNKFNIRINNKLHDCFNYIFGHNSIFRGDILEGLFAPNGLGENQSFRYLSWKLFWHYDDTNNSEKLIQLINTYHKKEYYAWNKLELWNKELPFNMHIDFPNGLFNK